MLSYYLRLALRSARRSRLTSSIVVAGLAVGIGTAMTFVTMIHILLKDPLADRGDRVFMVQLDSWEPDKAYPGRGTDTLPTQVTYQDAMALSQSEIPARASVHYATTMVVRPDGEKSRPLRATARAARADFFAMFNAPFRSGSGWTDADDQQRKEVVVLGEELALKVFGRADVVGETISLSERPFEVVGVLERWTPSARHYDMTQYPYMKTEELFLPFDTAIAMELATIGNSDGWGAQPSDDNDDLSDFEKRLRNETVWMQFYVEFDNDDQRQAFAGYVDDYTVAQREHGRFQRPTNNRLSPVVDVMERWEAVPPVLAVLRTVSLLFLGLCIISVVGLLLGKFLSRGHEVGIRRALGASRFDVFLQHLTEAAVLGVAGGIVGVGMAYGILAWLNAFMPAQLNMHFSMDVPMLLLSVAVAVGSGVAAGLYPAWRVCSTAPAEHLKA